MAATARRQLSAGVESRQPKPMLLSEAIRQGAAHTEEIHLKLYKHDKEGKVIGCCVIGAALSAVSRGKTLCYHDFLLAFEQWNGVLIPACPAGLCDWPHGAKRGIMSAMSHAFDQHRKEGWSRERVADYVQELEARLQLNLS